jgi:hypothetical protein
MIGNNDLTNNNILLALGYHHHLPLNKLKGVEGGWTLRNDIVNDNAYVRTWLSKETKSGNISRQEYVGMSPVFLLDIHHYHAMFDMYACLTRK